MSSNAQHMHMTCTLYLLLRTYSIASSSSFLWRGPARTGARGGDRIWLIIAKSLCVWAARGLCICVCVECTTKRAIWEARQASTGTTGRWVWTPRCGYLAAGWLSLRAIPLVGGQSGRSAGTLGSGSGWVGMYPGALGPGSGTAHTPHAAGQAHLEQGVPNRCPAFLLHQSLPRPLPAPVTHPRATAAIQWLLVGQGVAPSPRSCDHCNVRLTSWSSPGAFGSHLRDSHQSSVAKDTMRWPAAEQPR